MYLCTIVQFAHNGWWDDLIYEKDVFGRLSL